MHSIIEFSHKHLHCTYLLIFTFLYLILILIDLRFDLITHITQLTKRLSSSKIFLIIFFLASFLLISFFANSVLQRSSDHMYLFQSETFLKGRLWNNPPPPDFFTYHSIFVKNGKWLSRVFPGWPFLLSIPMFFHIPTWLLNPLLGTASLIMLFFIAKLLYSNTVGLLSVIAVLFSPFFLFNAASYVPHISCGLLILLAVYFYYSFCIKKKPSTYICWIGMCFGGAYLIRPFSTLCCLLPILIALIAKRKKEFFQKDIWYFMLGMLPFLLINFSYNYFITGNFLLSPFNWADPTDTVELKLAVILNGIDSVENQLLWMSPAILIGYFFTFIILSFKKKVQAYEFFFFLLVAGCFFYGAPGVSYGSRYYFEGYLLCVLTVIGRLSLLDNRNFKRQVSLALIVGFFTSFLLIPAYVVHYRHKIYSENAFYRLVEEKHLSNAIVFMPPESSSVIITAATNDPDLQNNVLYAHDLKERNVLLLKYFPTRDFYRFVPQEKSEDRELQKLDLKSLQQF